MKTLLNNIICGALIFSLCICICLISTDDILMAFIALCIMLFVYWHGYRYKYMWRTFYQSVCRFLGTFLK